MTEYLIKHGGSRETPQSEPMRPDQVPNSAGGYSWEIDKWGRLQRFLILGSEGGSYYASERDLTKENVKSVRECITEDGPRTVKEIVAVSDSGRATKNDPALYALAACISHGDKETRIAAGKALPQVARIGTHLYHFVAYAETMRGWGRVMRKAVSEWYKQNPEQLAYQAVKYRQRDGWSHNDLLRLAHPETDSESTETAAVFGWITDNLHEHQKEFVSPLINAFEQAQNSTSPAETAELVRKYHLPREALLTEHLTSPEVWEAMLFEGGKSGMPVTALIRNLANMTRSGILDSGSDACKKVVETITTEDALKRARVHPMAILLAQSTYAAGRGMRGTNTWTPIPKITDALDEAFYLSFQNVEPTGKSHLLALDVSSSMTMHSVAGTPLSARDASGAMALITMSVEDAVEVVGFTRTLTPLGISNRQRLDDVIRTISRLPFGGTDCAQPMLYAIENKKKFDAFVVYTDNETWAGTMHPKQALDQYRNASGIPARSAVVGLVSNGFTIADPTDTGMMDFVGMDTATPSLIADFVRGTI